MPNSFIEADPTLSLYLKLEADPTPTAVPRYGFTCPSCGIDTTNPVSILSNSTQELRLAWIQHLGIIHGISAPVGPCDFSAKFVGPAGSPPFTVYCSLKIGHDDDHELFVPRRN